MIAKSLLRPARLSFLPALKKSVGASQGRRAVVSSLPLPLASGPRVSEGRSRAAGFGGPSSEVSVSGGI